MVPALPHCHHPRDELRGRIGDPGTGSPGCNRHDGRVAGQSGDRGGLAHPIVVVGERALVTALYVIGLSMSRESRAQVGVRPRVLGVLLWIVIGAASLGPAIWNA